MVLIPRYSKLPRRTFKWLKCLQHNIKNNYADNNAPFLIWVQRKRECQERCWIHYIGWQRCLDRAQSLSIHSKTGWKYSRSSEHREKCWAHYQDLHVLHVEGHHSYQNWRWNKYHIVWVLERSLSQSILWFSWNGNKEKTQSCSLCHGHILYEILPR